MDSRLRGNDGEFFGNDGGDLCGNGGNLFLVPMLLRGNAYTNYGGPIH